MNAGGYSYAGRLRYGDFVPERKNAGTLQVRGCWKNDGSAGRARWAARGQPHGTGARQLQMSVDTGAGELTFVVYSALPCVP